MKAIKGQRDMKNDMLKGGNFLFYYYYLIQEGMRGFLFILTRSIHNSLFHCICNSLYYR
jgi:hypothetical protein